MVHLRRRFHVTTELIQNPEFGAQSREIRQTPCWGCRMRPGQAFPPYVDPSVSLPPFPLQRGTMTTEQGLGLEHRNYLRRLV